MCVYILIQIRISIHTHPATPGAATATPSLLTWLSATPRTSCGLPHWMWGCGPLWVLWLTWRCHLCPVSCHLSSVTSGGWRIEGCPAAAKTASTYFLGEQQVEVSPRLTHTHTFVPRLTHTDICPVPHPHRHKSRASPKPTLVPRLTHTHIVPRLTHSHICPMPHPLPHVSSQVPAVVTSSLVRRGRGIVRQA